MGEAGEGTDCSLNKVGMESQTEEAGCSWCAQDKEVMWPSTRRKGRMEMRPEGWGQQTI